MEYAAQVDYVSLFRISMVPGVLTIWQKNPVGVSEGEW